MKACQPERPVGRGRFSFFNLRGVLIAVFAAAGLRAAEFPTPFNSGGHGAASDLDPQAALAAMQLPEGFRATVFAAEPDVQNPIALAWDARGRLWIAENYTYAERQTKTELRLRDRVVIFEDAGGDGRFSSRRVFIDDVQRLGSVEVGRGGVWLMCPPQLLFVPDRDADGVPDGAPEVVLDGFMVSSENYHTFANGLRFGPDGWLYGRCGAGSPGEIGAPGSPPEARIPLRGTLWRYHPDRKVVEVLSAGATNPWGHDWDPHGELFFINTVNGHLWHSMPGAHFTRPHTIDPNPHVYQLIDMHADHWHFDTSRRWQESRDGAANAHGGGHAHAGVMIYQGDNWPDDYRGRLYTLNFHGRRINQEVLERSGSGYVGRHGPREIVFGDPWFRGIDLASGPDGGVFVLDWSDTGECHNGTGVSRTSGRIYKIVHGEIPPHRAVDVGRASESELVRLHTHRNDWFARQARLELAQRAATGVPLREARAELRALFAQAKDTTVKLRALWSLAAIGAAEPEFLRRLLQHKDEHLRAWAVRLLVDRWPIDTVMSERPPGRAEVAEPDVVNELIRLARDDASGLVRLVLASTLQRLPVALRPGLAAALAGRAEDERDHNLPALIWYGLIPLGRSDPQQLATVAAGSEIPLVRRLAARRLAEDLDTSPAPVDALLAQGAGRPLAWHADVLQGLAEGLTGWRRAPKPGAWDAFAARIENAGDAALRERVRDLHVLFGDGRALDEVQRVALDESAELAARKAALESLIESRAPGLRDVCEKLLRVRFLNPVAARGLALFDDPAVGRKLAGAYYNFHPTERGVLLDTLASRPAFARPLLEFVAAGRIPRSAVTPYQARQIRSFGDDDVNRLLAETWGELRDTAADKRTLQEHYKRELTTPVLAQANKSKGRAVFASLCSACHRLYGEGAELGPDLTGAGRSNLDYLLEHIVDPGAVVTADYRMSIVRLKDGRTLNGFIAARTPRTLTIRGMSGSVTVERDEVASVEESPASVMPEGLLEVITPEQRRDLIAYLMHPLQVPLEP